MSWHDYLEPVEFELVGDFYSVNFSTLMKEREKQPRICLQVTNRVEDLIQDVMKVRAEALKLVDSESCLDEFRIQVAWLLAKGGNISRFRKPETVEPAGDLWIDDKDFLPLLVVLRGFLPNELYDWMNDIMVGIWHGVLKQFNKVESNRGESFQPPPMHYSAHRMYRKAFYLYNEVNVDKFLCTVEVD